MERYSITTFASFL
ncbi:hypothetical protein CIB84_016110 [Bambusicola thoracicus]|uniref:Uncharacterized protein n=1 Tax=Bambusicola thoracicus TaxID=9083 RepID=A0A2P4S7Q5_BAMTH|nr:hypothetical protein CIB84_016110 [Bambusicola thoracicus]